VLRHVAVGFGRVVGSVTGALLEADAEGIAGAAVGPGIRASPAGGDPAEHPMVMAAQALAAATRRFPRMTPDRSGRARRRFRERRAATL
jgi:hypothetical protein